MAKVDSSVNVPALLSSGLNTSIWILVSKARIGWCRLLGLEAGMNGYRGWVVLTFHLSMSSVSHGFSFLCVEGILDGFALALTKLRRRGWQKFEIEEFPAAQNLVRTPVDIGNLGLRYSMRTNNEILGLTRTDIKA